MKSNRRVVAASILISLCSSPAAHADSWFSKLFKKHKTQPAPAAQQTTYSSPPRQKSPQYQVSLGANDNCSDIATAIANALQTAGSQVTVDMGTPTCDVDLVTYEGNPYRVGTITIPYTYVSHSFAGRPPELNLDVIGGLPNFDDLSDGSAGLFPTYQSCLDAAASISPTYEAQTGVAPLATFCQATQYLSYQTAKANPGNEFGPDRNYSLKIYSAGAKSSGIYVYERVGALTGDYVTSVMEMKVINTILSNHGYVIAYPSDPSQTDGAYTAYYAKFKAGIQAIEAGHAASSEECQDDTSTAIAIWAELGAPKATALCEPWVGNSQTLLMISLGNHVTEAPYTPTLAYPGANGLKDCKQDQQSVQASSSKPSVGPLCLPLEATHPEKGYYAQMYWPY